MMNEREHKQAREYAPDVVCAPAHVLNRLYCKFGLIHVHSESHSIWLFNVAQEDARFVDQGQI